MAAWIRRHSNADGILSVWTPTNWLSTNWRPEPAAGNHLAAQPVLCEETRRNHTSLRQSGIHSPAALHVQSRIDHEGQAGSPAANLTWPPDRYVRFHRTSGTRDGPIAVLDTHADWPMVGGYVAVRTGCGRGHQPRSSVDGLFLRAIHRVLERLRCPDALEGNGHSGRRIEYARATGAAVQQRCDAAVLHAQLRGCTWPRKPPRSSWISPARTSAA